MKTEVPLSDQDPREVEKLYSAIRRREGKLVGPEGDARVLPASLHGFLAELIDLLEEGKSVHIVQNQAKLSTIEAAAMLGVSRQFLVNLLEQGAIPHHKVGSHRRVYAHDLLAFKSRRDQQRRNVIRSLAASEAEAGVYDSIPATLHED